jgi:hypothetical protein
VEEFPEGVPGNQPPARRRGTRRGRERNIECSRDIAGAKATKRDEKGGRKSQRLIVPRKPGNSSREDPAEGSGRRVRHPLEGNMPKTPNFESVSTRRQRIAELAKQAPQMAFTSLNHHLDLDWLREAFHRTRKDGAPGVDGQTWAGYAENLERTRCSSGRW